MKTRAPFVLLALVLTFPLSAATFKFGSSFGEVHCVNDIADFNNDGFDDVLIVSPSAMLKVNRGDGFFEDRLLPDVPLSKLNLIGIADFNGDGNLDLIGQGVNGSYADVYAGNGRGDFALINKFTSTGGLHVVRGDADWDRDGKADLVRFRARSGSAPGSAGTTGVVTFFRGQGNGAFVESVIHEFPDTGFDFHAADFDRDGRNEIVFNGIRSLVSFDVDEVGNVRAPVSRFTGFTIFKPQVADIDKDGNLDLVSFIGSAAISVMFGDGKGCFPRVADADIPYANLEDEGVPQMFAIGDFSRLGRNEIVVPLHDGRLVTYAYINGALQQIGTTATELIGASAITGAFQGQSRRDLLVGGQTLPSYRPEVRLLFAGPPALTPSVSRGRSRSFRAAATKPRQDELTGWFEAKLDSNCTGVTSEFWNLEQEGYFVTRRDTAASDVRLARFRDTIFMEVRKADGFYYGQLTRQANGSFAGSLRGMAVAGCAAEMPSIAVTLTRD